ncbi:MAG TPA: HAMP domain-containing sensor histidine kinase [Polyangia bacterium]
MRPSPFSEGSGGGAAALGRATPDAPIGRLSLLYGLARTLSVADSVEQVFDAALDAVDEALRPDRSAVLIVDSSDVLRFKVGRRLGDEQGRAYEQRSPWARDPTDAAPLVIERTEAGVAVALFPLLARHRLLGALLVSFRHPRPPSAGEWELARAIIDDAAAAASRFATVASLEQTIRFYELYTGILGHDLRNPLAAILVSAGAAMTHDDESATAKSLVRILRSGHRMSRMIDQLLDFTRARIGPGIPLNRQPLDLAPVVRQVIDELDGANPDWSLRFEEQGDTRGVWDGDRLCQVFSNLVANSVQHGHADRGVDVSIDGGDLKRVVVRVHNMGAISDELAAHVFEPFSGRGQRSETSSGLGLGLFITRQIVLSHSGTIALQSSETNGTTFTVTLPRAAI